MAYNHYQELNSRGLDRMSEIASEMSKVMENLNSPYPRPSNAYSWDTGVHNRAFYKYNQVIPSYSNPQWNQFQGVPPSFPRKEKKSELELTVEQLENSLRDFKALSSPPPREERKTNLEELVEAIENNLSKFKIESKLMRQATPIQFPSLESQVKYKADKSNQWLPTLQKGVYEILPDGYDENLSSGEEESDEEFWAEIPHPSRGTDEVRAATQQSEAAAPVSQSRGTNSREQSADFGREPKPRLQLFEAAAPETILEHNFSDPFSMMVHEGSMFGELFGDSDDEFTPQTFNPPSKAPSKVPIFYMFEEEEQEEDKWIEAPLMNAEDGDEADVDMWREDKDEEVRYLLPYTLATPREYERRVDSIWVEGKHLRDDLALKLLFFEPP